ncbi:hypothetical protein DV738_g5470, partial [Chaetothyriales sp. CBS 135597]
MLSRRLLSKEDESQTPDAQVTAEDQTMINRFSTLHARIKTLDATLASLKSSLADLADVSGELELQGSKAGMIRYKLGDGFFTVHIDEALEMVEEEKRRVDAEVEQVEDEAEAVRSEMTQLKAKLYARFGRGINLEA